MIEVFDDWRKEKRVAPEPGSKGPAAELVAPEDIGQQLASFEPRVLNVHCYKDVGYPWVQVVFADLIDPGVALEVGAELAALAGEEHVYFNSLRPKAVYFLLEPAFAPKPDLDVTRYGESLASIREAWGWPESRSSAGSGARRKPAVRRATGR